MLVFPVGIDRPYYRRPIVTYGIMITCAIIEVIRWTATNPDEILIALGFMPGYGSLLTLFTSMFLHGGLGHLLGNMLFLYVTGVKVEDILGPWRYFLLYLACGVAANMMHSMLSGSGPPVPSIGASGAIAGIMGSYLILFPHSNVKFFYLFWFGFLARSGTFLVVSWLYLGFWFVKEIAGFILDLEPGVAVGAHIGGFAAGLTWIWAFFGWNCGDEMDSGVPQPNFVNRRAY